MTHPIATGIKIDALRQLVERKTEAVKRLESQLETEDAELVELERQLETLEDEHEVSPDETKRPEPAIRPADSRTSSERRDRLV